MKAFATWASHGCQSEEHFHVECNGEWNDTLVHVRSSTNQRSCYGYAGQLWIKCWANGVKFQITNCFMRHTVCNNQGRKNWRSNSFTHSLPFSMSVLGSGSDEVKACTKETNTKCACRGEFVPRDTTDSSTCMCNPGFGLKDKGTEKHHMGTQSARVRYFFRYLILYFSLPECLKCEDGYFSTTRDVPCRKWRE